MSKVTERQPPVETVIDAGWVLRHWASAALPRIVAELLRSGAVTADDLDGAHWRANYLCAKADAERAARQLDDLDRSIVSALVRGDLSAAAACAEDAELVAAKRDRWDEAARECLRIASIRSRAR